MRRLTLFSLPLLAAAACAPAAERPAVDTTAAPSAPAGSAPVVTETGLGPLRAGQTIAEAQAALGGALAVPAGADTAGCDYVAWTGAPAGVRVMVVDGRIARVDVDSPTVATAAGARVGDAEARVLERYAGRAAVTPHKYVDGHYVTVTPAAPADSAYRLVFETEGGRVTRYRAGRRPPVEYVEGCG